jgi:hypothetical protein
MSSVDDTVVVSSVDSAVVMSTVDSTVVMFIFRLKVPEVHRHVSSIGLPWAVITTKWFICLFAEVLPIEVCEC